MKIARELYGETPAAEFGAARLIEVRNAMIRKGWSRSFINRQVKRLEFVFHWGVQFEIVPATTDLELKAVEALKADESDAPESRPCTALSTERLTAVREVLTGRYRDIYDLLLMTDARPGELLTITTGMIDRGGEVWRCELEKHNTAHRGKSRALFFNSTAEGILSWYILADPDRLLFPIRRDYFGAVVKRACEVAGGLLSEWSCRRDRTGHITSGDWI